MKPAIKFVFSLLPEIGDLIMAMVDRGDDQDTIRRNITDQTEAIKASRERVAGAFEEKFGEKL